MRQPLRPKTEYRIEEHEGARMSRKSSSKYGNLSLLGVPAFWPMTMAAAMAEAESEVIAKNIKFVEEEIKIHAERRPQPATPNKIRLDLRTMLLRAYGEESAFPHWLLRRM